MSDYPELRLLVTQAGLLHRQPIYFVLKMTSTAGLLAVSLGVLVLVDNFWIQLLNATFLAFVFTQIGMVGHDIGHNQVARSVRGSRALGLFSGNLLLGLSFTWWTHKHNQHHAHPNHHDRDPDVDVPAVAFSNRQAAEKRGISRLTVRFQAFLFFPMLMLEAIVLRSDSIRFLIRKRAKGSRLELLLIAVHFIWYLGLVFTHLPLYQAILFVSVHQALFGLYLGSVFAPNHKGMLMVDGTSQLDFVRLQVLTARNIKGGAITDFLFGGLNYQIEHHLFPRLPRNRLREAQRIVRPFCEAKSISYHETTIFGSYAETLRHLNRVGSALRGGSKREVEREDEVE